MEMTRRNILTLPVAAAIPTTNPKETKLKWKEFNRKDISTWPTELGFYAVMIYGDSESIDGYEIYSFPDYQTFAYLEEIEIIDAEEYNISFKGIHDEDGYTIFAYYGPIMLPKYKDDKVYGWTGKKCTTCSGLGITNSEEPYEEYCCSSCAGTGDEWGLITYEAETGQT